MSQTVSFSKLGTREGEYIGSLANYLKGKSDTLKAVKIDWVKDRDAGVAKIRSMENMRELFSLITSLQAQTAGLLNCNWKINHQTDIVIIQAYRIICAELMDLYLVQNEAIVKVLNGYFEMSLSDATKSLKVYSEFYRQSLATKEMFDMAKANDEVMGMDVPDFKMPNSTLKAKLEAYLKELEAGKHQKKPMSEKSVDNFGTAQSQGPSEYSNVGDNSWAAGATKGPILDIWDQNDDFSQKAAGINTQQKDLLQQMENTRKLLDQPPPSLMNGYSTQAQPNLAYYSAGNPFSPPLQQQNSGFSNISDPFGIAQQHQQVPTTNFNPYSNLDGFHVQNQPQFNSNVSPFAFDSVSLQQSSTSLDPFGLTSVSQQPNGVQTQDLQPAATSTQPQFSSQQINFDVNQNSAHRKYTEDNQMSDPFKFSSSNQQNSRLTNSADVNNSSASQVKQSPRLVAGNNSPNPFQQTPITSSDPFQFNAMQSQLPMNQNFLQPSAASNTRMQNQFITGHTPFVFSPKPQSSQSNGLNPLHQRITQKQNSGESLFTSAGSDKYRGESQMTFDDLGGGYGNFKPVTNPELSFATGMNLTYPQSPAAFSTQSNYSHTATQYYQGMQSAGQSPGKFNSFSPHSTSSPGSTYSAPNFNSSTNPFKSNSTMPIPLSNSNQNAAAMPLMMGTGIYPIAILQNQTQPRMMQPPQRQFSNTEVNPFATFPTSNPYQNQFN